MGSNVYANKQGVSHKGSGAEANSTAPDVCKTPMGPAMVPIPYSNNAKSATLDKGSKTVKIGGNSVAIDGCYYSTSTGDQPGSGKGVISGTVGDKAEFANFSSDVMIEGKGVCRNTDLTTHNNKNTIGRNHDSSADPPQNKILPPPKDTVRIKVVEHLSWDNYDEKAGKFYFGHEDNKPLADREFTIRLPKGGETKATTNKEGIIDLPDQDRHGEFAFIFETKDAMINSKYCLFAKSITPLKKNKVEQNDPYGDDLKHTKSDIVTGVHYLVSVYQPCIIVDCHMHIESGNCAPLPFLWKRFGETMRLSRESIEGWGGFAGTAITGGAFLFRVLLRDVAPVPGTGGKETQVRRSGLSQAIPESIKTTREIGDDFMKKRYHDAHNHMLTKEKLYDGVSRLVSFCIPLTMDMEYAHVDGYFGLKIYNVIYKTGDEEKKPVHYWTPRHGHWNTARRENKGTDGSHPLANINMEEQSEKEYENSKEIIQNLGIPGIYCDKNDEYHRIAIKAEPLIVPDSETVRYENWKDQITYTELAMLKNPLRMLPLFHYDPRRWQVHGNLKGNMIPFEQVGGSGLYLGFKMYTAQGYRPWDVHRLPILKEFYRRCCSEQIPIINHCTPDGAGTFDKEEYFEFSHPNDPAVDELKEKSGGDPLKYFHDNFISPKAWERVLEQEVDTRELSDLHLCLAHYGGNTDLGREWGLQIIELMKNYDNVYTDISSSFASGGFRKYFKDTLCADPAFKDTIRHRILFGTDWYMTLLEGVDYLEYCREAKEFLDRFDTSLWLRFTQANPYRFYRLNEYKQVGRIADNIIDRRKNDEEVTDVLDPLEPADVTTIKKEAAYIMQANIPYVNRKERP